MTPSPDVFESDAFQRQLSPVRSAAVIASGFVTLGVVAVVYSTWFPVLVAYPLLLILGLAGVRFRRKGRVRVDEQGLWWRGSLAVPRGGIVSVLREADAIAVRTDSSWHPVQRFFFEAPRDADALAVALGSPDERPAVPLRVGSPASSYGTAPFFVSVSVPVLWLFATFILRSAVSAAAFVANLAAASLLLALLFAPTRLTLGAEGMEIRWLWRSRWVRWRDVASVEALKGSDAIVLHLKRGADVRLSAEAAFALSDANATEALVARIHNAIEEAAAARPHAVAAALSRGSSTTAEWVARLRGLISREASGYRAASVSADEVAEVLRDHSADPALRVAAAVAYAPAGGVDAVKHTAESVASTRVRVALDAAAGSDDEAIAVALDAVDEERREG